MPPGKQVPGFAQAKPRRHFPLVDSLDQMDEGSENFPEEDGFERFSLIATAEFIKK